MDYRTALDYILAFADYERSPGYGYAARWDLRRMEELLQGLGSPHLGTRTVHIAGSKGKGSVASMVASALSSAGFRTGLYTSPHLHTMRERIRVDGTLIAEQELADLLASTRPAIEATNRGPYGELSTFEILTALAFMHFRESGADFQVLEAGLGGRLDATNVVRPDVCVITSISLDHMAVLGNTVAQIAAEKAGIIKPGVTVVSSPQVSEVAALLDRVCAERQARLIMVGRDVTWEARDSSLTGQSFVVRGCHGAHQLFTPLLGDHQMENAAAAVAALESLGVSQEFVAQGLAHVQWPGRLEVLRREPLLIADGAHNGDSARRLRDSIRRLPHRRAILIVGASADKDVGAMVAELATATDVVIATASRHPRATSPSVLASLFAGTGVEVRTTHSVGEAISMALAIACQQDLVCATGSLFVVAEVLEWAKGIAGELYPTGDRTAAQAIGVFPKTDTGLAVLAGHELPKGD